MTALPNSLGAAFERLARGPGERVSSVAQWVVALTGWRRAAVAVGAGSLSVLAMAPFFLWPVLFATLPVLVWLIDGSRPLGEVGDEPGARLSDLRGTPLRRSVVRAATAGWWFGFGYFFFGLFWIGEAFLVEADKFAWLLPFAVTLMPAGLAVFTGLAAASARIFWPTGMARVLVLALTLSVSEWLRGHILTGFPWNVFGYALTYPLPMMQAAALIGIYGLTILTVIIFASPLVSIADARGGKAWGRSSARGMAAALIPLVLLYGAGVWRLSTAAVPVQQDALVRIVQASVPQRDKWNPEKQASIFNDQLELSRHDPAGHVDNLEGVTHLVWPEAAMPFLPLEHPEALNAIGELLPDGTQLITGALRLDKSGPVDLSGPPRGYNSLMVFDESGRLSMLYDKIHLVPFGEYLPFQETLESVGLEQLTRWRGGFSIGPSPRPVLSIPGLSPVVGLICYEAIFPAAVVQDEERPELLINITNDGWFGNTTGPYQHFHQARVRAVEEGLPLIRAANNGITAVIGPYGIIVAELGLNERGVVDARIPVAIRQPLYALWGDWTFVGLAIFVIAIAIVLMFRGRNCRMPNR